MSADRYSETCPRCAAKLYDQIAAAAADVEAMYGNVPLQQMTQAQAQLDQLRRTRIPVLEEYWEITGASTGRVTVEYSAECRACDLSVSFKVGRAFFPKLEPPVAEGAGS